MECQFEPGSSLRLSLPDGVIDITPQTTQEERQKILDDLRSRYPDMLKQSPELEQMILGTYQPPDAMIVEDISTPEGQRKAVEDMQKALPDAMRQDPRIERALTGDEAALDELVAEGVSTTASVSIVKGEADRRHARRDLVVRVTPTRPAPAVAATIPPATRSTSTGTATSPSPTSRSAVRAEPQSARSRSTIAPHGARGSTTAAAARILARSPSANGHRP